MSMKDEGDAEGGCRSDEGESRSDDGEDSEGGGVVITDRLRVPLKIKDSYRSDSQVVLRISR